MSDEMWKAYSHGMAAAMQDGGIYVPSMLLRSYRQIELSDSEAMLLLQLIQFRDVDHNDFPTPEELADRMGTSARAIGQMLARLVKDNYLAIDEYIDDVTGMQAERYNWNGWLLKAAEWSAGQRRETKKAERRPIRRPAAAKEGELFVLFEQEFGRLLSPMECESISVWLDQDKYSEELIRIALKEAVFAGKLSLKYIDRILYEWSRNRVTNADEARAHSQKFRGGGRG